MVDSKHFTLLRTSDYAEGLYGEPPEPTREFFCDAKPCASRLQFYRTRRVSNITDGEEISLAV
jgi:hypothetical protein